MSEEFKAARQRARREFTNLIAEEDAKIDLARLALLIAAEEYPGLDVEQHMAHLEELAACVRLLLKREEEQPARGLATANEYFDVLHALNTVLFEQEHFRGNRSNYYDPQNSFLNKVLERRLGIPITLSLLYMEVGKRLGLHIEGISLPFQFIVYCSFGETGIYIDPYERGKFLSEDDCRRRLLQIFKHEEDLEAHWLQPVDSKQVLVRLLDNLKHIYIHKGDFQRALQACDRILLLKPQIPIELRDRGVVHFQLKYYARALRDLSAYVELAPQAEDLQEVRQQIKLIRQMIAMMN
ncbi:MAG TPA: transglutaminase-like domain-containing protein [Ktedonobacteraceae bacterium]|nr:transglutaminase-like domain-containing protein [Ktedonobacteraceae bacterium]